MTFLFSQAVSGSLAYIFLCIDIPIHTSIDIILVIYMTSEDQSKERALNFLSIVSLQRKKPHFYYTSQ